ncbi:MAG TPA: hypothetical protein VMT79_09990, partial [Candidatus Binatia bacterium]|nr:hypothetical protein [Candidatus Binatia bacterium]
TNQTTGTPNASVTVPAGGSRTFVLALTPTAAFSPTDVSVVARCDNTDPSARVSGVNTLLLSGSTTAVPDLVALVATASNDGIVTVPGAGASAAFAVATVNVGVGDTITATADTAGVALPVSLTICQTDPGTGTCLAAAGPRATASIGAGVSSTFAVFVSTGGAVPFDPATNRVVVRFTDGAGVVRGATSVAVRTR